MSGWLWPKDFLGGKLAKLLPEGLICGIVHLAYSF